MSPAAPDTPDPAKPLRSLGFLTIGLFDPSAPAIGHEDTLRLVQFGEDLGFDSAWLRHRHLQFGISSPMAVLAALSQRTHRIRLGTAVTPLGAENPFRLAEDLATVDVLSDGRLEPGFSVGVPMNFAAYRHAIYPEGIDDSQLGFERLLRLRSFLAGEQVSGRTGREGFEEFSGRVEPHSPGLASRLWYGSASSDSARLSAENGFNMLTSSVIAGELSNDFDENQIDRVRTFRAHHPLGTAARISQGLVVIPTDSATRDQVQRYRAYVDERNGRVGRPFGPKRMLFAADLLGPSEELADRLLANPTFHTVDEVAFALPFTFTTSDYEQILRDIAERLAPLLGWSPQA